MSRSYSDAKLQLGEPWASKLADFCAANYNAEAKAVIREALDEHIDRRLNNEPEMKKRFNQARQKRRDQDGNGLSVVTRRDD